MPLRVLKFRKFQRRNDILRQNETYEILKNFVRFCPLLQTCG
jgi:hypothetical protein